jgi:uncharacterized lipoprotein YmbA
MNRICIIISLGMLALLLSGCLGRVDRTETNYYVLDYQPSTERTDLMMSESNAKSLYVMNSRVNRTYNRNQIVAKESFYRVRFMSNDLWANRLSDAVPNIISQRLRAYNIFSNVTRDAGQIDPDFYLETNIMNIEKIEGENPRAFLRIEFVLRDSTSENVVIVHRNERYQELTDDSTVYLVQVINNMIMEETNTFAAMCIMHFAGRPISHHRKDFMNTISAPERFYFEQIEDQKTHQLFGELLLSTKAPYTSELPYRVEMLDSLNTRTAEQVGEFNTPLLLSPGRYRVITGHNEDIRTTVEIFARQRTVVSRTWSELRVRILDLSQTQVRQIYDLWLQNDDDYGYTKVGSAFSLSDDEHGIEEKLWILPPGNYMLTLGGYSWSDLRDFATICLSEGDSHILTVIVDPSASSGNIMVGAGVLAEELGVGTIKFHKGAIHGNVNLSSNNEVNQKDPTFSLNVAGQFDNTIEHDFRPFHFSLRSIYDLGANVSTGSDLKINLDSYTLKNVLLLYPWGKEKKFFNNFAFYGRTDLNTHFWDEYRFFSDNKNYIVQDHEGNEIMRAMDQDKIRTKIALYPLRMKEGTGLTYRIAFNPNTWVSLRGGYGWQQNLNHRSLSSAQSIDEAGISYDVFTEAEDKYDRGIETTLILSAVNLLNFFSINSTFDALFPIEDNHVMPRFENENRINIRIYRNISVDFKVNLMYDKSDRDWLVYDYSTYLRMSLFY